MLPETQNNKVFAKLWLMVCSKPANTPIGPHKPKAKLINPMFSILEYANKRLMSNWTIINNAATNTESKPNTNNKVCGYVEPTALETKM